MVVYSACGVVYCRPDLGKVFQMEAVEGCDPGTEQTEDVDPDDCRWAVALDYRRGHCSSKKAEKSTKTVKRSQLTTLRMVAGNEKKYGTVIIEGIVKDWVGIGWVGGKRESHRRTSQDDSCNGGRPMKIVEVVFSHQENVPYYRTLPNNQLICIVDGAWHTAIDDGTWEEPDSQIDDTKFDIRIVEKADATN